MFSKTRKFWGRNEIKIRLALFVIGLMLLTIQVLFPTEFMLDWREATPWRTPLFMVIVMFLFAGIYFMNSVPAILDWVFIVVFFLTSVDFAPPYWTIAQALSLGLGLGAFTRAVRSSVTST